MIPICRGTYNMRDNSRAGRGRATLVMEVSRMARRDLLTGDERRALFGVPLDRASLAKFYTVLAEDRSLIEARRGDANRREIGRAHV